MWETSLSIPALAGTAHLRRATWTPARLFAGGRHGAWYDPGDATTLFQDVAGTIPAGVGDGVALMLDKSGNGNHAVQDTVSKRPFLAEDSLGHAYLAFDGTRASLVLPNVSIGNVSSDNTAVFAVRPNDGGAWPYVLGSAVDGGFVMLFYGTSEQIRPAVVTESGLIVGEGSSTWTARNLIYSADWDRETGTLRGWANTVLETTATGVPADKTPSTLITLGAKGADSARYFKGRIYGGFIIDAKLPDSDRRAVETFLNKTAEALA